MLSIHTQGRSSKLALRYVAPFNISSFNMPSYTVSSCNVPLFIVLLVFGLFLSFLGVQRVDAQGPLLNEEYFSNPKVRVQNFYPEKGHAFTPIKDLREPIVLKDFPTMRTYITSVLDASQEATTGELHYFRKSLQKIYRFPYYVHPYEGPMNTHFLTDGYSPSQEKLRTFALREKLDLIIIPVVLQWSYKEVRPERIYHRADSTEIEQESLYRGYIKLAVYTYDATNNYLYKNEIQNYVEGDSFSIPSRSDLWSQMVRKIVQDIPYQRVLYEPK